MPTFSFIGLFRFLLSRWKSICSVLLIGLVLGSAFGAYRFLAGHTSADTEGGQWVAKADLYVTLPAETNGSAVTVYVNNLGAAFRSPEIINAITLKYPQDSIAFIDRTDPQAVSSGSIAISVTPVTNSSVFTFQADAATEAISRDVLGTMIQAAVAQARNIEPGLSYWTSQTVAQQQPEEPLTGVKSIFLIGLAAAALSFALMLGIYGLYYLFSDFITSGETLALLMNKKLLGELSARKKAKKGKADPSASQNKLAVMNLAKALEQKKVMMLIPADARSDIAPVIRKLSGGMGDVRIVFSEESDNEGTILAGLEDGKPSLIVAPSIIHSQLSGVLAARVGTVVVAAVDNASRLRDIMATQAWIDSAGAETAGYLFIR